MANYRLSTALYALAAINPSLIPGLALGNALAGTPQGPVDMLMGAVVGFATAWACSKMGKWSPLAVLVIPTLLVPVWLRWLFGAPYWAVVAVVGKGQVVSAILATMLMQVRQLRQLVR